MSNLNGNQFQILQSMRNDFKAFSGETLTVTTTAQNLTVPEGTRYIFCQVESTVTTDAIRYWIHGIKPTSTTGYMRSHGDAFDIIEAENIKKFSVIQGTAGTTKLIITYYK